ncbi:MULTISPECIES: hypothetical protein [Bradyrhizobium]|uniref:hypothetical protein n=1 Tax=Bradyrhizobium TaxID=374 RepID=UPI001FE9CF96|nr:MULTISPECIES: hypothetical protein [Bradyrhizobium]MCP3372722.1 hypothetical protein [Bradyrhizobium cajani]WFU23267.1 hypothetical protein QA649_35205 [Bradyrhizobium sp. CB1717]
MADASKVGNATIRNFEGSKSTPQHATLDVLKRALESAGVIFLNDGQSIVGGPGVRLANAERHIDWRNLPSRTFHPPRLAVGARRE